MGARLPQPSFHLRLLSAAALAAFLSACSTPATRVVLLPQEDGSASAVVVRTQGGEQLLNQPYQRATAPRGSSAAPARDQADAAQLRQDLAPLFTLMPPPIQNYTLYFDIGGTVLTPESQQQLPQLLSAATSRIGGDIVVIGHTDTKGAGPQNDALSLRRAQEVRQMLVQRGFSAQRVEAAGRGERDLAVPTADDVDEPRNRRVMVEVR
ncbi:MAG: OmpA family protein [Comamonadaceae bacterium]|nr:MAG: OmpA family protein [Comamonadaceae bacterium]